MRRLWWKMMKHQSVLNVTLWVSQEKNIKFEHLMCKECNELFRSDKDLKIHNSKLHSIELHQCLPCKLIFPNKTGKEVHIKKKHNKNKKYECDVCSKVFTSQSDVLTHMQNKHAGDETNRSQWECPICDKTYESKDVLVKHMDRIHFEKDQGSEKISQTECRNGVPETEQVYVLPRGGCSGG